MAQPASSQLAEDHHSLGGLLHIYRYDYFRYQCLIESTGQVQGFKLLRSLRQLFCMSSALWCDFHSDFCIFFDLHTLHVKKPKRSLMDELHVRGRCITFCAARVVYQRRSLTIVQFSSKGSKLYRADLAYFLDERHDT